MCYIIKDGEIIASTPNKSTAIDIIRDYQEKETHYLLRANFSIIEGTQEFISYPKPKRRKA